MHSRSFLHRTHTEPRAAATDDANGSAYPLGFADVRSDAPDAESRGPRAPIGFAPPAPLFVTELSFRRTAQPARIVPRAELPASEPGSPGSGAMGVGHATSWTPASRADAEPSDEPRAELAEEPTAEADAPLVVDEVPQPAEKKVPFYKREITLRRRRPEPSAALEDDAEPSSEPAEDVSEAEGDAVAEPAHGIPIGFAAPPEPESADETVDEAAADAHDEPEAAEAHEPVAVAQADEAPVDEDRSVDEAEPHEHAVEDEPVAQAEELAVAAEEPGADQAPGGEPSADAEDEPLSEVEDTTPVETTPVADEVRDVVSEDEAAVAPIAAGEKRRSIRARRGGPATPKPKASGGSASARGGRKIVGLKIGASQIAAAVIAPVDGRHELVTLARRPLEPGIVVDGEVRDGEALRDALKAFFAEHKLPRKDVRVGVASNRIGVRTVDISGIEDDARFDNAVRFKAHEVLPVSVSESVLDYRVVEERVTETGDTVRRVLLVVAPRDQVEPFAAACTDTGLKLGGIDLEALALLRTFVEPQPAGMRAATDTATVAVAIGHESTTLLVSGGGACEFTRVFDWGGLALQQAIALELDIHTADASAILHGLSLSGEGTTGLDEERRTRALDAVRMRLTPFARELVSSLQFYQAQDGSLGIGEIVITGGTSHLHGLAEALHQMIGVSVRVGDPLQRVHVSAPIDEELRRTIGSLAVPIGLAIVDDAARGVNLLPDELRKQKRKKPSALSVALPVAAVVPLAAMGFLFMQANGDVSDQQSSLEAVQAQIDALPEPTRPVIDASLAVEQQQRAAALASVLGGRLAWDRVLGDLSRVLPENVWLTSLSAKTPDPVAPGTAALPTATPGVAPTPTGVTISGLTYSLPDVALLMARLNTVPSLTNVALGSSTKTKIGKRTAITFSIVADIDGNGGAQ